MSTTDRKPSDVTTTDDHPDRPVGELVSAGSFVTLITRDADGEERGRPVTVQEELNGLLRFLVSRSTDWARALPERSNGNSTVETRGTIVVAEPHDNLFATLTGTLWLRTDRETVERLWSPAAKVFFTGPDDPDAVALEFQVTGGQWWGGPTTTIGNVVALVRAAISGDEEDAGDAGEVVAR